MPIMTCTCAHAGQDKLHGKDRRVFNEVRTDQNQANRFRCTVCKRERER